MGKEENLIFLAEENQKNPSEKKKKLTKKIISGGIIVLIVLGFFLFLGKEEEIPTEKDPVIKNISVLRIGELETRKTYLEKTLKITSKEEVSVVAEYAGKIQTVNFETGDKVETGEVLAQFSQLENENPTLIDLKLAQESLDYAKSNYQKVEELGEKDLKLAKNNIEMAKIALDSKEGSTDKKIARENLEIAERQRDKTTILVDQQINSAISGIDTALANYEKASLAHNKTIIKAPVSGVIVSKDISQGNYLNFGTKIAVISSNKDLFSDLYLSEVEAKNLKEGEAVEIFCEDGFSENLAKVENISSLPNSQNYRYAVSIKFNSSMPGNTCLSPNKFIKARLKIELSEDGRYFLPLSTVKIGQTKTMVFVVEGENVHLRAVKMGAIWGDFVEIKEGLKEGELVANEGSRNLREGDLVNYQREDPLKSDTFGLRKNDNFLESKNSFYLKKSFKSSKL